jgi:hypothetical protein
MKQTFILNIHDTGRSIRDLIVTSFLCILAIVQERFEKITLTICITGRPQDHKNMRFLAICFVQLNVTLPSSRCDNIVP